MSVAVAWNVINQYPGIFPTSLNWLSVFVKWYRGQNEPAVWQRCHLEVGTQQQHAGSLDFLASVLLWIQWTAWKAAVFVIL